MNLVRVRAPYRPALVRAGVRVGEIIDAPSDLPEGADPAWDDWYEQNWKALHEGEHLDVPVALPHPSKAGFEETGLAENVGQVKDWVLPLLDRSRLHVHEYRDGQLNVHRDAVDPGLGVGYAMWHWFSETGTGRMVAVVAGTLFAALVFVRAVGREGI